jgi:hypothetical protein
MELNNRWKKQEIKYIIYYFILKDNENKFGWYITRKEAKRIISRTMEMKKLTFGKLEN